MEFYNFVTTLGYASWFSENFLLDRMIHGKEVQLYRAKAFLEEDSEPRSSFRSPWVIKSFLQVIRGYANSFVSCIGLHNFTVNS